MTTSAIRKGDGRSRRRMVAAVALMATMGALAAPEDIARNNIFDPKRQPWPDKEAPTAPAPPLSKDDVLVYGIVAYGPQRKAIVRLAGKLKDAVPSAKGRQYVMLTEGQALGGYTLESVLADKLVFASPGGKATIGIEKKNDRPGPPPTLPVPVQGSYIAVVEMPMVTNPWPGGGAPAGTLPTLFPVPVPAGGQLPGIGGQDSAPAVPSPASAPAPTETAAAPPAGDGPKTLLEAIQAAKAAQQAGRAAPSK